MKNDEYHWVSDPYWIDALNAYCDLPTDASKILLDLRLLDDLIFTDRVSYELADAMASVVRHEGYDGNRGAPRLIMAFLAKLIELRVATVQKK